MASTSHGRYALPDPTQKEHEALVRVYRAILQKHSHNMWRAVEDSSVPVGTLADALTQMGLLDNVTSDINIRPPHRWYALTRMGAYYLKQHALMDASYVRDHYDKLISLLPLPRTSFDGSDLPSHLVGYTRKYGMGQNTVELMFLEKMILYFHMTRELRYEGEEVPEYNSPFRRYISGWRSLARKGLAVPGVHEGLWKTTAFAEELYRSDSGLWYAVWT